MEKGDIGRLEEKAEMLRMGSISNDQCGWASAEAVCPGIGEGRR